MNASQRLGPFVAGIVASTTFLACLVLDAVAEKRSAHHTMTNGLTTGQSNVAEQERRELQSMLLKYAARCALREDQVLEGPPDARGVRAKYPGSLGVAPEWRDGTCDGACQEKVSSCLIALINRTGKHVQLSLLSAGASMAKTLMPNDNDIAFPHQEGTFFGNVFSGEAFACRGKDVEKGAQVKRFCALEPASCTGLAEFADAGRCEDVCEMTCVRLSDGSQRCAASSCKDPSGHRWAFPITTYLRNQIEAGNADKMKGTRVSQDGAVEPLSKLVAARYERVDFGDAPSGVKTFVARVAARQSGGRIEVWLDGRRRLGVLDVDNTDGVERAVTTAIDAKGVSGSHTVVLKLMDATKIGHLSTIEFR